MRIPEKYMLPILVIAVVSGLIIAAGAFLWSAGTKVVSEVCTWIPFVSDEWCESIHQPYQENVDNMLQQPK